MALSAIKATPASALPTANSLWLGLRRGPRCRVSQGLILFHALIVLDGLGGDGGGDLAGVGYLGVGSR